MAKRTAGSELNHDNWNQEEEKEEAGTFRQAAPETMQNRVIKAAKRRSGGPLTNTQEDSSASKSPFATFGGFKATTSSSASGSMFACLSNKETSTNNGKTKEAEKTDEHSPEFYSSLQGLNQCVSQWIKKHVDSNPFIILSPIFKDYERYLAEINEKESKKKRDNPPNSTTTITESKPAQETSSFFASAAPKFNFGSGPTTSSNRSAGFTFASSTSQPFTFSNVTQPETTEEDAEEEPPKEEIKPVKEEGATYEKRCKVYVKKDGEYQDRGVGTLFLKPVGEKTQLIVRADTNLGNILLNTLLTSGMPVQRMGSNNVMLVCIPTPDSKPPPIPVLLKVKTGGDADEVLDKLKQHLN